MKIVKKSNHKAETARIIVGFYAIFPIPEDVLHLVFYSLIFQF